MFPDYSFYRIVFSEDALCKGCFTSKHCDWLVKIPNFEGDYRSIYFFLNVWYPLFQFCVWEAPHLVWCLTGFYRWGLSGSTMALYLMPLMFPLLYCLLKTWMSFLCGLCFLLYSILSTRGDPGKGSSWHLASESIGWLVAPVSSESSVKQQESILRWGKVGWLLWWNWVRQGQAGGQTRLWRGAEMAARLPQNPIPLPEPQSPKGI